MPAPIATVFPVSLALPSIDVSAAGGVAPAQSVRPLLVDLPQGVDLPRVLTEVAEDGVAAPAGQVDGLAAAVGRAGEHGIRLSIVVLDVNPARDSQLRDLATEVGAAEGGTVLVLSPSWVGTYSDSISRVHLESGQDRTYTGNAVVAADNFVDELIAPSPPWALLTVVIVAVVTLTGVAAFAAKYRRSSDSGAAEVD